METDTHNSFIPDWRECKTVEQFKKEYTFSIEFTGPGWYVFKHGALLVIPADRPNNEAWKAKSSSTEKFWFYVYDNRDPLVAFNSIATAPMRVDERE